MVSGKRGGETPRKGGESKGVDEPPHNLRIALVADVVGRRVGNTMTLHRSAYNELGGGKVKMRRVHSVYTAHKGNTPVTASLRRFQSHGGDKFDIQSIGRQISGHIRAAAMQPQSLSRGNVDFVQSLRGK